MVTQWSLKGDVGVVAPQGTERSQMTSTNRAEVRSLGKPVSLTVTSNVTKILLVTVTIDALMSGTLASRI